MRVYSSVSDRSYLNFSLGEGQGSQEIEKVISMNKTIVVEKESAKVC